MPRPIMKTRSRPTVKTRARTLLKDRDGEHSPLQVAARIGAKVENVRAALRKLEQDGLASRRKGDDGQWFYTWIGK